MSLRAIVLSRGVRGNVATVLSVLSQQGWDATDAAAEDDVLGRIDQGAADLVVIGSTTGFNRPGIVLTHAIRERDARCPVLLFTEESSEQFAVEALRAGVTDMLTDGASDAEISDAVRRFGTSRTDRHDGTPLIAGERLVGSSTSSRLVRQAILRAAHSESNVLITGETGTGKELVADLIHRNSRRSTRPMVSINCAAIPDTLLESELFGYDRGAFTGAQHSTPGKLEQAEGGTIFFDEIGDMSLGAQAKILRAIESREINRLGGRRPIRLNLRVISATHQDLDTLAMEDRFRKDLYFRINVARVHIPPLRERKSEIPILIDHYIREFNRTLRGDVHGIDRQTMDRLIAYEWPGNIRELRNVIESAFVSKPAGRIIFQDLPEWLRRRMTANDIAPDEQERIIAALAATNWNKSKAAQALQWSRMTLYRKMTKYHIV